MTAAVPKQQALAYLEVLSGTTSHKHFALGAETIIGREDDDFTLPENSICLPDARVSRHHARIFQRNGQFYLEDTQSTNGTFLNTFRLSPGAPCLLREGSNVQVGGVYLRFRPGGGQKTPRVNSSRQSKRQPEHLSEIGFNEEFFDFSLTATPESGEAQADVSMVFRAPEMPSPE